MSNVMGLLPISLERTLKNFWAHILVKRNGHNPAFELAWRVFPGCLKSKTKYNPE